MALLNFEFDPLRFMGRAAYMTLLYPGYGVGLAFAREFGGTTGHALEKTQRIAQTALGLHLLSKGRLGRRSIVLAGSKVGAEDYVFNWAMGKLRRR